MIGDVDGDGESVGKGTDDCRVFCVFSICFLVIIDFNEFQGVCELLEGDTTTDKIELLFILKFLSAVPRYGWQFVVLPPCMFANVAPALCVSLGVLHSAPVCAQLPYVKQYFPTRGDWDLPAFCPLPLHDRDHGLCSGLGYGIPLCNRCNVHRLENHDESFLELYPIRHTWPPCCSAL